MLFLLESQIDGEAYMAISEFIEKLREQEPIGRQVASIDEYSLQSDPKLISYFSRWGFNFHS